ncbi:hypothetical protein Syun_029477 [Stephania yunnanensis]|uniref:Uncharacterized protein n=1 Tax=Stephania yunnanensis TaxID=152371 RepID=A0AAP0ED95_9MAGN
MTCIALRVIKTVMEPGGSKGRKQNESIIGCCKDVVLGNIHRCMPIGLMYTFTRNPDKLLKTMGVIRSVLL